MADAFKPSMTARHGPTVLSLLSLSILVAVNIASPWWYGAVESEPQWYLHVAVLVALGAVLIVELVTLRDASARSRLPTAMWLLLGALSLGAVQLVPLPFVLIKAVSPTSATLWRQQSREQDYSDEQLSAACDMVPLEVASLSLYPESTRCDVSGLVLAVSVFGLASLTLNSRSRRIWFSVLLAINGGAIALHALVLQVSGKGIAGSSFGPFVNRNNAAGYLNLCLGAALGLAYFVFRAKPRRQYRRMPQRARSLYGMLMQARDAVTDFIGSLDAHKIGWILLCAFLIAAVLSSLSRGGTVSLITAGLVVALLIGRRLTPGQNLGLAAAYLCVLMIGGGLLTYIHRAEPLRDRLSELIEDPESSGRVEHWTDTLGAMAEFWRGGSGLGTYRYAHGPYQTQSHAWFFHAENQYIEAMVDGGLVGFLLLSGMVSAIAFAALRLWRSRDVLVQAFGATALFALICQGVHSCFDFGLYLPSNYIALASICGAAAGEAVRRGPLSGARLPDKWACASFPGRRTAIAVVVALLTLCEAWSLWHTNTLVALDRARQQATIESVTGEDLDLAISMLESAVQGHAGDAEAHLQLANLYVQRYRERVMDVLRATNHSSQDPETLWQFTSPVQVHGRAHFFAAQGQSEPLGQLRAEPLIRENLFAALKHGLLARRCCPLIARAHLLIAQLSVLVTEPSQDDLHLQRTRQFSPSEPGLLYLSGLLHLNAGRRPDAYSCWRASLRLAPTYLKQMMTAARHRVQPSDLVAHVFPPNDPELLFQIATRYFQSPDQVMEHDQLLDKAEDGLRRVLERSDAPEASYLLGKILVLQNRRADAIAHYEDALKRDTQNVQLRYELALLLLEANRLDEALEQARDCLRIQPEAIRYQQLLRRIVESQLR